MEQFLRKLNLAKVFRYYLSVMFLVDGADKFYNLVANWADYLAPQIPHIIHVGPGALLPVLGIIEIIIGVLLWFSARIGGIAAAILLAGITLNLLLAEKFYNVALVDFALAIAALALAESSFEEKPAAK